MVICVRGSKITSLDHKWDDTIDAFHSSNKFNINWKMKNQTSWCGLLSVFVWNMYWSCAPLHITADISRKKMIQTSKFNNKHGCTGKIYMWWKLINVVVEMLVYTPLWPLIPQEPFCERGPRFRDFNIKKALNFRANSRLRFEKKETLRFYKKWRPQTKPFFSFPGSPHIDRT